ncbi:MAG: DUF1583 domain-containing protein [Planctomycetales bacterium]|nr:DUF1583 domain-containing protein [Planctomycetales bacterium]
MLRLLFLLWLLLLPSIAGAQTLPIDAIDENNLLQSLRESESLADADRPMKLRVRAATIHRLLQQLSADERYQVLREFTFPATAPDEVHGVTAIGNVDPPPRAFARIIGQRPRPDVFATPAVGNVHGLFSSAWLLLNTAKELGQLHKLAELAGERTGPSASDLRLLLSIVGARGVDAEQLLADEQMLLQQIKQNDGLSCIRAIVVAAAAEGLDNHTDYIASIASAMEQSTSAPPAAKGLCREILFLDHDDGQWDSYHLNGNWIASRAHSRWYCFDGHLAEASSGPCTLFYRYPIIGDFRFESGQLPSSTDDASSITYDGVHINWERWRRPGVNQRVIERHGDIVDGWINGHPVDHATATNTSPWLRIHSGGLAESNLSTNQGTAFAAQNLFRNLTLSGSPRVPDEVVLLGRDSLHGWTPFPNEATSTRWNMADGVLRSMTLGSRQHQSLFSYDRPLQQNESIEYEFFAADDTMVHPAVGRLAFLLETDGVKIHWVTDEGFEWSGLPPENQLIEPLYRRGANPIPLLKNQWNRVVLSRTGESITILLNETLIYQRPIDEITDTRFGFYVDPTHENAQVRVAKLRGEWPEKIDPATLFDAEVGSAPSETSPPAILFPESDLQANSRFVFAKAMQLDPSRRYEFLANWVLPSSNHPTFRLTGHYEINVSASGERVEAGCHLASPALELISVAKQLRRLEELGLRIEQQVVKDTDNARGKLAMSALVALANGKRGDVHTNLESLYKVISEKPGQAAAPWWPELLVSHVLVDQADCSDLLLDILRIIDPSTQKDVDPFNTELLAAFHQIQVRMKSKDNGSNAVQGEYWRPTTSRNIVQRSSNGARWIAIPGEVQAIGGNAIEQLFFQSPLQGDFEVQFDHHLLQNTGCQVLVAGQAHQLIAGQIKTGPIDGKLTTHNITPRITTDGLMFHQRFSVKDGVCTVFANGRQVIQTPVQTEFPWLAIRQGYKQSTRILNLSVSGDPVIPEQLRLDSDTLVGWRSYYHHDPLNENSPWRYTDGEIIGERIVRPAGSGDEQLLYYQRPLSEDATVGYEFFYQPNEFIVHPALDRTALVIDRSGVGTHFITDGAFDDRFVNKINRHVEPSQQRVSPATLLRENEWNAIELSIRGDTLQLKLNGQPICVRPIASQSERTFGLFYYAEQTSARIRNVTLRGDWPKRLPEMSSQRLTNPMVAQLDTSRDRLAAQLQHDFSTDGLPKESFTIANRQNATITTSSAGVTFQISSPDKWTQSALQPNFQLSGDFDISVQYSGLQLDSGEAAIARLIVPITSANALDGRLSRSDHGDGKRVVLGQTRWLNPNGAPVQQGRPVGWEATSGTMRIARRGSQLHMLVKGDEADQFRYLGSYEVTDAPTYKAQLLVVAQRAKLASVTWHSIDIRAEQIKSLANPTNENRIFVAAPDGDQIKKITDDIGGRGTHGSPEFSPDGRQIAFDTWLGNAATAHIYLVNTDGSDLRDLGSGTMPTFTPDGKQIAFSSVQGMMLMDVDGGNRKLVSRSGWGIQMSPLGDSVSFTDYDNGNQNLYIVDLKTGEKKPLLEGALTERYSTIYWNCDWSPDGKEICFSADNRQSGERELAVVSVEGSTETFDVLATDDLFANIAWHPDGDRIAFHGRGTSAPEPTLMVINRNNPTSAVPLLGGAFAQSFTACDWTRDGKSMVLAGGVMKTYSKTPADPDLVSSLDTTLDAIDNHFVADLSGNSADANLLKITAGETKFQRLSSGIAISAASTGKDPFEASPQLKLFGDFDLIAEVDGLEIEPGGAGEVRLVVPFVADKIDLMLIRRMEPDGTVSLQARGAIGNKELFREYVPTKADRCDLRIARRDAMTHLMFRESAASKYHVLASYHTGDGTFRPQGIRFLASSSKQQAMQLTLTKLAIHAEKLFYTERSYKQLRRVHTVNIDGTNPKQLVGDLPGLGGHGSPKFSPDGEHIAFDTFNQGFSSSHVMIVNSDGSGLLDLGQGSMPSFFPDGKRLAFTANGGLMTMTPTGDKRQLIRPGGLSVKVSPDGSRVVFIDYSAVDGTVRPNLILLNLESGQSQSLLVGEHAKWFDQIQWNGAWSPDGQEFVFRARLIANKEFGLYVVNTAGSDNGLTALRNDPRYTCDLGWHPDGKRIFTSRLNEHTPGFELVFVPRDPELPDELIPGQDPFDENFSSGVSPDGKRLTYTSNPLPKYPKR